MILERRAFPLGAAALAAVLLAGCRGEPLPKVAPVRGKVVFKNKPVTAADIYFLPDASKGNQGSMATSVLQEDGSFTMITHPDRPGVMPGAYKVTITTSRRPEKELDKYRNVTKTPLEYKVPDEGLPNLVIELK
jgi:hypothetical protein